MRFLRSLWTYPVITVTVVVLGGVLALAAAGQLVAARWIAIAWVGAVVIWTLVGMIRDVLKGHVGLDILAVVAMVATLAVDEYVASLIIVLMLSGGEALEDFAQRRAKRDLTALLDRSPRIAHVLARGDAPTLAEAEDVPVDEVGVGDMLLVRPSEIVPVDGILLTESGTFDESSITGVSMPVSRDAGDEVLSGAVNGSRAVRIRASRTSADSQYQQIVALVHAAEESRAPVVR
ncbi:MAG: heavy metal translocating P-type ATPase, partial [Actinomycetota bacterium]|nr:heavy metal translocating P-type ATPase [Actinomycetota bacterium]